MHGYLHSLLTQLVLDCRATTYRTGRYSSAIVLRESGTGKVLLCARSALGGTWNVCASNNEAIVTVVATKRRKYGAHRVDFVRTQRGRNAANAGPARYRVPRSLAEQLPLRGVQLARASS